jgi:hypothetical protein
VQCGVLNGAKDYCQAAAAAAEKALPVSFEPALAVTFSFTPVLTICPPSVSFAAYPNNCVVMADVTTGRGPVHVELRLTSGGWTVLAVREG